VAELTKQLQDFKGLKVRLSTCSTSCGAGPPLPVAMFLTTAPRQVAWSQYQAAARLLTCPLPAGVGNTVAWSEPLLVCAVTADNNQ
jgi:hypothetical protein